MGFKEIKHKVITCLEAGAYEHEVRKSIDVKNLFQCGQLSDEFVLELVRQTRGNEYEVSPHHMAASIDVHVFKPYKDAKRWYIKFYFIDPDVVSIRVHESGE